MRCHEERHESTTLPAAARILRLVAHAAACLCPTLCQPVTTTTTTIIIIFFFVVVVIIIIDTRRRRRDGRHSRRPANISFSYSGHPPACQPNCEDRQTGNKGCFFLATSCSRIATRRRRRHHHHRFQPPSHQI
ncbi:hypothetical protein XA68_10260 [Ophiocordyceps unilateralis]|uniref:Uncharacterized protein n=1 Tax=Ophiocordyceps unilateralis TaxID=268505 RepID=A0A2A9P258_OPHUN|nr:hypothetical protein XA68_10260 [Ophiocordyceps unilateralis]